MGGKYSALTPFRYYYKIFFLLNYLKKNNIDILKYEIDFSKINKNLERFESEKGIDLEEKLLEELKYWSESNFRTVCYFSHISPGDLFIYERLEERDDIEMLLMKLADRPDIHCIKEGVRQLDKAFKCIYLDKIELLMKEYPDIEILYYPDNFWWRHPPKFIN